MKRFAPYIGIVICAILASIFIYPIFSGLILLPLDLLVSNSGPWHMAGTILLKNPFMSDSIIQMFPWKHLTFMSLTSGVIPLWNPYQFLGMPFMAAMKPLVDEVVAAMDRFTQAVENLRADVNSIQGIRLDRKGDAQ